MDGVLDTFLVRPVLVPAYLVLVNSGRFGRFSRVLGAAKEDSASKETETTAE